MTLCERQLPEAADIPGPSLKHVITVSH